MGTTSVSAPLSYFDLRTIPGECGKSLSNNYINQGEMLDDPPLLGVIALAESIRYDSVEEVSAHQRFFAPYGDFICRTTGGAVTGKIKRAGESKCGSGAWKLSASDGVRRLRHMETILDTVIAQEAMISGVYQAPWLYQELKRKNFNLDDPKLASLKSANDKLRENNIPNEEKDKRKNDVNEALKKLEFNEEDAQWCTHKDIYFATLCSAKYNTIFRQNLALIAVLTSLQESRVGSNRSEKQLKSNGEYASAIESWKPDRASLSTYKAGLALSGNRDWLIKQALPNLPIKYIKAATEKIQSKESQFEKNEDNKESDGYWALMIINDQGEELPIPLPSADVVQGDGMDASLPTGEPG